MVLTVSVAVCADELVIDTEAGTLHVAGSLAAVGVITQLRLTVPVNPPDGVTIIVDVLPVVAPGLTLMLPLLLRANVGGTAAVTVTFTVVVRVILPEVPVTVTT